MLIKSLCFAIQFACHIREDLERVNEIISENMAKLAATSSFALLRIKASFKALFIDAMPINFPSKSTNLWWLFLFCLVLGIMVVSC